MAVVDENGFFKGFISSKSPVGIEQKVKSGCLSPGYKLNGFIFEVNIQRDKFSVGNDQGVINDQ